MRKFRFVLIGIGVILIAAQLWLFDYENWSWSENWGGIAVIAAVVLAIISMIWSSRHERKQERDKKLS